MANDINFRKIPALHCHRAGFRISQVDLPRLP